MKMNILNLMFYLVLKVPEENSGIKTLLLMANYLLKLAKFDRDNTVRCF